MNLFPDDAGYQDEDVVNEADDDDRVTEMSQSTQLCSIAEEIKTADGKSIDGHHDNQDDCDKQYAEHIAHSYAMYEQSLPSTSGCQDDEAVDDAGADTDADADDDCVAEISQSMQLSSIAEEVKTADGEYIDVHQINQDNSDEQHTELITRSYAMYEQTFATKRNPISFNDFVHLELQDDQVLQRRRDNGIALPVVDSSTCPVTPRTAVHDSNPYDITHQRMRNYPAPGNEELWANDELYKAIQQPGMRQAVLSIPHTRPNPWIVQPKIKQGCFVVLFVVLVVIVALWIAFWISSSPFGIWFPVYPSPLPGTMHVYQLDNPWTNALHNRTLLVWVHAQWVLLLHSQFSAAFYPNGTTVWMDTNQYRVYPPLIAVPQAKSLSYDTWTTDHSFKLFTSDELQANDQLQGYYLTSWQQNVPVPSGFDIIRLPVLAYISKQSPKPFYYAIMDEPSSVRPWYWPDVWENHDIFVTPWQDRVNTSAIARLANAASFNETNDLLEVNDDANHTLDETSALQRVSLDCGTWNLQETFSACMDYHACILKSREEYQQAPCGFESCDCRQTFSAVLKNGLPHCGDCMDDGPGDRDNCLCWLNALFYATALDHMACYKVGTQCEDSYEMTYPCKIDIRCKYSSVGLGCAPFLLLCKADKIERPCIRCNTL